MLSGPGKEVPRLLSWGFFRLILRFRHFWRPLFPKGNTEGERKAAKVNSLLRPQV